MVGGGLLRETFTIFRTCGQGRNECVVYWAGPVSEPAVVDRVIHPDHDGAPDYYEIASEWLNTIWPRLYKEQIAIRVQVHTHGRRAFHSKLDDEFPLLQTEGFRSLVVPNFGLGAIGLEATYLAELHPGGVWLELNPPTELAIAW
jgi:hypothetical protein